MPRLQRVRCEFRRTSWKSDPWGTHTFFLSEGIDPQEQLLKKDKKERIVPRGTKRKHISTHADGTGSAALLWLQHQVTATE
jgi:hypothetical protein